MVDRRINWSDWGPFVGVFGLVVLFAVGVVVLANRKPHNVPFNPDPNASAPEYPQRSEPLRTVHSSELKETLIVPTLDTPLVEGKSAIWCSSFQLVWNQLKDELAKGPVELHNAGEVSSRLNRAPQSKGDLSAEDLYTAFGRVEDGIGERIGQEMQERFPGLELPQIDAPVGPEAFIAFAFLKAGVRFTYEFRDSMEPLEFTDAQGKQTAINTFGILPEDHTRDIDNETFRGQVALLWKSGGTYEDPEEFALDLCRHSSPYQIVLARTHRQETLALTLAELDKRVKTNGKGSQKLGYEDEILVPNMYWRLDHRFSELEGSEKTVMNGPATGNYLQTAFQGIEFKLDRSGAGVSSAAWAAIANGGPTRYYFDRPFLIYLKKRDAEHPFFVMWVDNAELMQPFRKPEADR